VHQYTFTNKTQFKSLQAKTKSFKILKIVYAGALVNRSGRRSLYYSIYYDKAKEWLKRHGITV